MYDDTPPIIRFFRGIYWILIIYGQIFGILHSIRYHSQTDVLVSIFIPPWAWYRSVELFWHDENDVTNRQLHKDFHACVKLINNSIDTEISDRDIDNELQKIKDRIKNYPLARKEYLHEGTLTTLKFTYSIFIDSKHAFEDYSKNGKFRLNLSQKTKTSEKTLAKKFKMKEETEATIKAVKYQSEEILRDISEDGFPLKPENKRKLDYYINYLDNQFGEIDEDELSVLKELFDDVDLKNTEI